MTLSGWRAGTTESRRSDLNVGSRDPDSNDVGATHALLRLKATKGKQTSRIYQKSYFTAI